MADLGFSGKSLAETWGGAGPVVTGPQQPRTRAVGAGMGGGGAAGGPDLAALAAFIKKQQADNLANQQGMQQKIEGLYNNFGTSALANNAQLTTNQKATANQSLTSRGLGNSTIQTGVANSIDRQGQVAADRINEQKALMQGNFLNSIQQPGMDMGLYAQLLMQPGALEGPGAGVLMSLLGGGAPAKKKKGGGFSAA